MSVFAVRSLPPGMTYKDAATTPFGVDTLSVHAVFVRGFAICLKCCRDARHGSSRIAVWILGSVFNASDKAFRLGVCFKEYCIPGDAGVIVAIAGLN